jgi:hypothetical protein
MGKSSKFFAFFSSVWMQIRVGFFVGLPTDDSVGRRHRASGHDCLLQNRAHEIVNKAPGRMTRNGLGSLEIGSARDRGDE